MESSRALAEGADQITGELNALVSIITASVRAALPGLPDEIRGTIETVCRTNTALALAALRRDRDAPAAVISSASAAQAREFVHRDLPVETLLAVHRAWHAHFERAWLANVRIHVCDQAILAAVTARGSACLFALVDAVAGQVAAIYAAEKTLWTRSSIALRQQEVSAVIGGGATDVAGAGRRLQYPLDHRHIAFVAWLDEDRDDDAETGMLMGVADTIRRAMGGEAMLCVPAGGHTIHGWVSVPQDIGPIAVAESLAGDLSPLGASVTFGEPADGVSGFRASHLEALRARRVVLLCDQPLSGHVRFDDLSLVSLLTHDPDEAERFIERYLGPLCAETAWMRCLVQTLQIFLDKGSSYVAAARELGVHKNTVHNRVRRAETFLPRHIDDDALGLHIAILLHQGLHRPLTTVTCEEGVALSSSASARRPSSVSL